MVPPEAGLLPRPFGPRVLAPSRLPPAPRPWVSLVVDFAEAAAGEVGVDLGGGEAGVAEQFLDGAQVGARFEQVGGEGVPEGVGADAVLGASAQQVAMDDATDAPRRKRATASVEEEPRLI